MSYPQGLQDLYEEIIDDPAFKHLQMPGVNFVGGHGPLNPKLMLIGEAPGKMENARKIPFQGPAGINLTNLLLDVDIDIAECFLTNTLKYWPWEERTKADGETYKGTRAPTETEQKASASYIRREIGLVNPWFVGLCGRVPTQTLYPSYAKISVYAGRLIEGRYVPLFHPSMLGYSPHRESEIRAAYQKLADHMKERV